MANPDIPIGFRPTAPINPPRPFKVDSSNSTALFVGDVVMQETDGNVAPASAGNTALIGSTEDYLAASTAGTVMVYDDPNQSFLAQDDGTSTTTAQLHIGSNADHVANAGSTTTLLSGHEIDISDIDPGTGGFNLVQLIANPDYSVGANSIIRVRVMEHLMRTGKTAV